MNWIDWIAREYVGNSCIFDNEELESVRNEFKRYLKAHVSVMLKELNQNIEKSERSDVEIDKLIEEFKN